MDTYAGRDLEALAGLRNYQRWIMRWFSPYVRGRVIEYGAGTGTFSVLLQPLASNLVLVEPFMHPVLHARFGKSDAVSVSERTLEDHVARQEDAMADTVVMVNVLEHIEHDTGALKQFHRIMTPGGHLLIFVPALSALMSAMDRHLGHCRRYHRLELRSKLEEAGFDVLALRYFDFPGVVPWLVVNRWLGATEFNRTLAWIYDRGVVPIARAIEVIPPPFGKNLIAVARRRDNAGQSDPH